MHVFKSKNFSGNLGRIILKNWESPGQNLNLNISRHNSHVFNNFLITFVTLKVIIEQQFQEEIWGPQDFMEQHLALDHQIVHSGSNSFSK